jgi:hypothetical protein
VNDDDEGIIRHGDGLHTLCYIEWIETPTIKVR